MRRGPRPLDAIPTHLEPRPSRAERLIMAEHWTAEENRNFQNRDHMSGHIITWNPTPNPRKNADGLSSLSLILPALIITRSVVNPAKAAKDVAFALNSSDQSLGTISSLQSRIEDRERTLKAAEEEIEVAKRCFSKLAVAIWEAVTILKYGENPKEDATGKLIIAYEAAAAFARVAKLQDGGASDE